MAFEKISIDDHSLGDHNESVWNACDITPPSCYDGDDVLIRQKDVCITSQNHSSDIFKYRLGVFCADEPCGFVNLEGNPMFSEQENPKDFEYKFIK